MLTARDLLAEVQSELGMVGAFDQSVGLYRVLGSQGGAIRLVSGM